MPMQSYQIYVTDPKAVYHMLVKDANIYEETTWYTECVLFLFDPAAKFTQYHRQWKYVGVWPRTPLHDRSASGCFAN